MGASDAAHCLRLFLGRTPEAVLVERYAHGSIETLLRDLFQSPEFRDGVLSPLMLGDPLPHEQVNVEPPFLLTAWAQRTLPVRASNRRAVGAARSWAQLLELLLSDEALLEFAPAFRAAGIDEQLSARVAAGPLARVQHSVVGAIDAVSAFEVRGWAVDLCDRSLPVVLDFYADNIFLGTATCGEHRPDVQDTMGGSGHYGFHHRIASAHRASLGAGRRIAAVDRASGQSVGQPALVSADAAQGWDVLQATRLELAAMRVAIERIEARLPDLSRLASTPLEAYAQYWERFYRVASDVLREQRAQSGQFEFRPLISIVLPTWNSDPRLLRRAIDSVRAQTYGHWELIVTDDGSTVRDAVAHCRRLFEGEARIRWLESAAREGIALNTNRGIAVAAGDYLAFLDHDDELAPDALFQVASCLQSRRYGLIYSDEDRIEDDPLGQCVHHTPFFKPDLDPDLLRAMNYICHLVVLRRELVVTLGGLRAGFEGAQDHDLLLRAVAVLAADDVHHVARILYHWRVSADSMSGLPAQRERIQTHIVAAVNAQLQGLGAAAEAEVHHDPVGADRAFATRVRWHLPSQAPVVSIIVPTRDRLDLLQPCVQSILDSAKHYPGALDLMLIDNDSSERTTQTFFASLSADRRVRVLQSPGVFNWSAINNSAARGARGEVLIFLNNDTVVRSPDWITELAANAWRADVGAVGARLLYADGTLQHAGVVLGVEGVAGHECAGEAPQVGGYFGRSHVLRSAAAVTGACMASRRSVFEEVGGFDEHNLRVAFNDVDYCMKLRRAGYRVVYNPFATLYHFESKSRGRELTAQQQARHGAEAAVFRERWGESVWEDPYYNPHFERFARPFDRLRPPV